MGHNGACNQLGEVSHKGCVLQEIILGNLTTVGIHHIGHLLEGKETDAQRQQDVLQNKIRVEDPVQIHQEEIKIFEVEQDPQIQQHSSGHFQLPQPGKGRLSHGIGKQIVYHDGDENDGKVAGVKITIKPQ